MKRATRMLMVLLPILASSPASAGEAYDSANPPDCAKPVFPANPTALGAPQAFNDRLKAYQACIKDYVDTQSALANRHVNAANTAVEDANAFIADSRARLSALR